MRCGGLSCVSPVASEDRTVVCLDFVRSYVHLWLCDCFLQMLAVLRRFDTHYVTFYQRWQILCIAVMVASLHHSFLTQFVHSVRDGFGH